MPRLETLPPSYVSTFASLFSAHPPQPRREIARALLLRSVRLRVTRERAAGEDEERLEGFQRGTLPLRIRPVFVVLNIFCILGLGLLGFHPNGQAYVPINDKILHFICFLFATGLFYFIWDVDEPARRVWIWRHMPLLLTWLICFSAGVVGSEVVQSLLPYKTFQWGDVLANFMGSSVGLFFSYHAERRYRTRREIERLYEPLDQELYGDEEEDEEDSELGGGTANVWKSSAANGGAVGQGKKVRFGQADVVDAEPAVHNRKEDLFRIDDDDEGDVWRDASSRN